MRMERKIFLALLCSTGKICYHRLRFLAIQFLQIMIELLGSLLFTSEIVLLGFVAYHISCQCKQRVLFSIRQWRAINIIMLDDMISSEYVRPSVILQTKLLIENYLRLS